MNKQIIYQRFNRSVSTYRQKAVAQKKIAEHLFDMICQSNPVIGGELLEVGCGTGFLTEPLLNALSPRRAILNDLCERVEPSLAHLLSDRVNFIAADAESATFQGPFNLIASSSTIQWFADPELFISKSAQLLCPDGILAISTFGVNNLHEIKTICGAGLSYPNLQGCIANYLQIKKNYTEQIVLYFATPRDVLLHLKQTGVTGNSSKPWTASQLAAFEQKYSELFGDEKGSVSLTYEPVYIIASK